MSRICDNLMELTTVRRFEMGRLILIHNVNAPNVGDMQSTWADPPQGPPSKERKIMSQTNTPAVAATGATTVWTNAPQGPPEIAQALIELSQVTHNASCLCDMCDLDVTVTLSDGNIIYNVTFAKDHGDSTEIRTEDTTRHVVTTRIVELEHNNI